MRFFTALVSAISLFQCSTCLASPPFDLAAALASVKGNTDNANKIIDILTNGELKGVSYERLANFTDRIGNRVSGSENLKLAENTLYNLLKSDGLENVALEPVQIPNWIRGNEWLQLESVRLTPYRMNILGLGNSVGTNGILTANAIVVDSFDSLSSLGSAVNGSIVVFNQYCDWKQFPVDCYGQSVQYRVQAADESAKYGAVAALVRSVASFSIDSPHTGTLEYYSANKIPSACITVEDAAMLARLQARGEKLTLSLYMEAKTLAPATGHNVVAEIQGSLYPNETVIVSGHLDSWDVGQGAMDDGGGFIISWSVLSALAKLNIRPKRTIRFVAWSCEEFGGIGAQQYYDAHKSTDLAGMSLVMESDLGVFKPTGIQFTGSTDATTIITQIGTLLTSINASTVTGGGEGTDIDPWMQAGVPGASLANDNEKYFYFHHSNGDTMSVLDPTEMDLAAATWAVTAFAVADLPSLLPRASTNENGPVYKRLHKNW